MKQFSVLLFGMLVLVPLLQPSAMLAADVPAVPAGSVGDPQRAGFRGQIDDVKWTLPPFPTSGVRELHLVAIPDATIHWATGQIPEIPRAHTWRTTESSACSIETAAPPLTMRDNSMTRPFASTLAVAVCLAGSSSGHQLKAKEPAPTCKSIEGSWSGTWGGGSGADGVVYQPVIAEMSVYGDQVTLTGFPKLDDLT